MSFPNVVVDVNLMSNKIKKDKLFGRKIILLRQNNSLKISRFYKREVATTK